MTQILDTARPAAAGVVRGTTTEAGTKNAEPILSLRGVAMRFRAKGRVVQALSETTLDIREGEFVTVVGPSGCGKSTLMNLLVGLYQPSAGSVLFRGAPVRGINRRVGYVTQADNLYPWRTLRANVEFPLELRGMSRAERRERADALIRKVGLAGFEENWPHELSGGMRQRANIIRTLAYDPEVVLMDEPFGPLDAQTRLILQEQLLGIWQETGKTVVFITHDLGEAVALADRVVVMSARPGRIKAVAEVPLPRPRDLFHLHGVPAFRATYDMLWQSLEEEVKRASPLGGTA